MYGYVYKTTNLINNKIYVGQHKKDTFDQNYYGSGILFKQALKKYGKENFRCELLESFDSKDELDTGETLWIDKLQSYNPSIGYNLSRGGNGNSEHQRKVVSNYMKTRTISDETRHAMSNSKLGNTNGHGNFGRVSNRKGSKLSDETIRLIKETTSKSITEWHKNMSEEDKMSRSKAISQSKKGKIAITDGTKNYFISESDWEQYDHSKYYKMSLYAYQKLVQK